MISRALTLMLPLVATASGCNRVFQLDAVKEQDAELVSDTATVGECLTDNFEMADVDLSKWTSDGGAVASVAHRDGQLAFTLGAAAGANYAHIRSLPRDMTNDSLSIEVIEIPNTSTAAEAGLSLHVDQTNSVEMFAAGGLIYRRVRLNDVLSETTTPFIASNHRYWRVRFSSGYIHWETSSDRTTWMMERQAPTPFDVTSMQLNVFAGTYQQESQAPGGARFDNLVVECL